MRLNNIILSVAPIVAGSGVGDSIKVLFLDVDGVLNRYGTKERIVRTDGTRGMRGVEPIFCQRLNRVLEATGAKIVLSSTWRVQEDSLPYLWENLGPVARRVFLGNTPYLGIGRHEEIKFWLNSTQHKVSAWAAVDDLPMPELGGHAVQTDEDEGLTEDKAKELIALLNK